MFEVYHAKKPNFGFGPELSFPAEYEKVAVVESDNVEEVFYLTNTVEREWWTNERVRPLGQFRSTSVGDIIVNIATGEKLRVASCGWEKV